MMKFLHTLLMICAFSVASVMGQGDFQIQMYKVPGQSQVVVQAKITGANVSITGGESTSCAPGPSDFLFNCSLCFAWPADANVESLSVVTNATCGDSDGWNFQVPLGFADPLEVNGGTDMGQRFDKTPAGGVTAHPLSWMVDTWYDICTVNVNRVDVDGGIEGLRLLSQADSWAGGPSFLISNYSVNGVPNAANYGAALTVDATPLPLKLIRFEANKHQDRSVLLNWETSNEVGTSHFVVQRSEDGIEWQDIGAVDAAGNSVEARSYSFMDRNVYDGRRPTARFMYRLLILDLDSRSSYSNIDVVKFSSSESNGVGVFVYPNPSTYGVNVEFSTTSDAPIPAKIEIFNALGQLVFNRDLTEGTEFEYIDYGTANIPGGSFFLRVTDKQGAMISEEKLIITR